MTRLLPYPILSIALLMMWLVLHGSAEPATLIGGVILALAAPVTLSALEMPPLKLRRPGAIVKLIGVVLYDIVRSNVAVARIVYGRKRASKLSAFIVIPLDMRNRYGLTMLATIITCTPGTLWVQYDSRSGRLLMHILDMVDPEIWPELIKGRYERLLMEIFE
ncbi:MAG TPA: Na+/H+ antiporter subunit E [Hyphomonadaceae bacterium]|nr:Na+/H+ antiporter subunit E [Hyphomonadaceae bacterium]HPN05286.1 Na+/H+ antiporter subunit E [Hyphomonadaceae bacterium]